MLEQLTSPFLFRSKLPALKRGGHQVMAAGVLERLVLQTEAAALASADLLAADSRLPARLE